MDPAGDELDERAGVPGLDDVGPRGAAAATVNDD